MDSSFFNPYTNQTSMQDLMKEIGEAIRLDDESQDKEAYLKYTSCIYKIATNLLHNARVTHSNLVVTPNVSRQVKLLQQCVDRVNSLVQKMEQDQDQRAIHPLTPRSPGIQLMSLKDFQGIPKSNSLNEDTIARAEAEHFARTLSPIHQTVRTISDLSQDMDYAHKSLPIHIDVPALSAENNPHMYNKVRTMSPLEKAHAQNKSLIIAYKARMKRLNKSNFSAYNYSLTLQRKMAENLAIAKAQEEELAKKMKARQERLEEEAARRFAHPNDLSLEEKEHQEMYKNILDYENDVEWLSKWRQKLSRNREDPVLICQIVQEILRCSDHPLTQMLRKLQFKIHEQLYPLVANKHVDIDLVKVDFPHHLWPTLDEVSDILPADLIRSSSSSSVPAPEVRKKKRIRSKGRPGSGDTDNNNSEIDRLSSSDDDSNNNSEKKQAGGEQLTNNDADLNLVTPEELSVARVKDNNNGGEDDVKDVVGENGGDGANEKLTGKEVGIGEVKERVDDANIASDANIDDGSVNKDSKKDEAIELSSFKTDAPESGSGDDCTETDSNNILRMPSHCQDNASGVSPYDSSSSEDNDMRHRIESIASTVGYTHVQLRHARDKGRQLEAELTLQRHQARLLMQQISRDYDSIDTENFDDLFDDDDDNNDVSSGDAYNVNAKSEGDSPSRNSDVSNNNTLQRSQSSQPKQRLSSHELTDEIGFSSLPPTINQATTSFSTNRPSNQAVSKLTVEAYERHLRGICNEIHLDLDKLLQMMIVAYEALDTPVGKDQCAVALEEPFFKPIWKTLLRLFRVVNHKKETVMACVMTSYKGAGPETLKVREKFCLANGQGKPYQEAIDELLKLSQYYTVICKLDCIVKVCHLICECVHKYYTSTSENNPKEKTKAAPVLGADDLVPVLTYVIVSTGSPQLVSECLAVTEFIAEGYMMGEEGYCLTTLRTAMEYLISLFEPLKEN